MNERKTPNKKVVKCKKYSKNSTLMTLKTKTTFLMSRSKYLVINPKIHVGSSINNIKGKET